MRLNPFFSRPTAALALAILLMVTLTVVVPLPSQAQRTPGLDETRERVQELTQQVSDTETELSKVETAAVEARTRFEAIEAESQLLVDTVVDSAIVEFMRADAGSPLFGVNPEGLTSARRAETLNNVVIGADADAIEDYRSLFEDLAVARAVLVEREAAAEQSVAELRIKREELGAELARLEDLEAERLAEIERRRAAEQAAAERAAAERAAAERAAASQNSGNGNTGGGAPAAEASGGGETAAPVSAPAIAPTIAPASAPATGTGTLKACPVAGAHSFIDSWGFPRSGGRRHKGVDMMASIGTPIAAPVSGTVTHRSNRVGGRSFHLDGSDGNYYYGTHLSGYEKSGQVNAGDIIGYVGDDGNARGIPHLHFEIHPGGGSAVNPYPFVSAVC